MCQEGREGREVGEMGEGGKSEMGEGAEERKRDRGEGRRGEEEGGFPGNSPNPSLSLPGYGRAHQEGAESCHSGVGPASDPAHIRV